MFYRNYENYGFTFFLFKYVDRNDLPSVQATITNNILKDVPLLFLFFIFLAKVAVIQKFPWHAISSNMAAPYKTLLNFGNIEIFELQLLCQNYD